MFQRNKCHGYMINPNNIHLLLLLKAGPRRNGSWKSNQLNTE